MDEEDIGQKYNEVTFKMEKRKKERKKERKKGRKEERKKERTNRKGASNNLETANMRISEGS
jgi:hypothetical protein